MIRWWPKPWTFEKEGHNGGPCVKDANGQVICALFWPVHSAEDTDAATGATYILGEAIANAKMVRVEPMAQEE